MKLCINDATKVGANFKIENGLKNPNYENKVAHIDIVIYFLILSRKSVHLYLILRIIIPMKIQVRLEVKANIERVKIL